MKTSSTTQLTYTTIDKQNKNNSGHTLNIFAKILPASLLFEARVRPSVTYHAISSPQFSRKKHLAPFLTKGPVLTTVCQISLYISTPGIQKLLANLKPHKATGPDLIPPTVLKELSHEISPILEIIFNISLQTGQVPNDWKEANIAPIFKKGDQHNPSMVSGKIIPVKLSSFHCSSTSPATLPR